MAEILRMEAERQNIKLALNTEIERIEKRGDVFAAVTKGWTYEGDALILAAGSAAAPETGSMEAATVWQDRWTQDYPPASGSGTASVQGGFLAKLPLFVWTRGSGFI